MLASSALSGLYAPQRSSFTRQVCTDLQGNMNNFEQPLINAWETIKADLRASLPEADFITWIAPLVAKLVDHNELIVPLPNMVFYQGIHNDYLDKIEQTKSRLGLDHILIRFEIEPMAGESTKRGGGFSHSENLSPYSKQGELGLQNDFSQPLIHEQNEHLEPPVAHSSEANANQIGNQHRGQESLERSQGFSRSLSYEASLNRSYTFETFVRGTSNQFALATCQNVAENPGKAYNPLFIYGSTGLGKTHLLHAVGNYVHAKNPNLVVTYISSERFMNEMVYCLRFNKMWDFRQKFRHCDVFLVDDIQFIAGKSGTQEEFFHTFNTLYGAKKQIVITSDLFPQDIPDIEDRLRNRFQWGLIADIQPPDVEHRIAILLRKAEKLGTRLTEDVAEYIAKHAKRNVRELEGALHRIHAFASLQGEPISMDLAIKTFKDVLGEPPKRLTVEHVQKVVAEHFKLKVADLKSKKRQKAFAHPRQIAMYLSRKMTGASFPEIGDRFGGKDHTTVMHNVNKIKSTVERDLDLKAHVESLERLLEQAT